MAKKNKHQVKLYKKYHDYLKKNRYLTEDPKYRKADRISSKERTNDRQNSVGEETAVDEKTEGTTVIIKFDKDSKENA